MQVGDRFPIEDVGLANGDGPAVVYFYPRAGTDTCTLEAHEFNRSYPRLRQAGVRLVGVSVDAEDDNSRFAAECALDFPLVSDSGGELTRRVGLMKSYGEHGDMAARTTLLLDEDGVVRELWDASRADMPAHVQEVVERSTRQT